MRFWPKRKEKDWWDFYDRFEERFRGSPENVYEVMSDRYGGWLQLHKSRASEAAYPLLDVGCGRGEMLLLAKNLHLPSLGIDASPRAIQRCRNQKLQAKQCDGLKFLKSLPSQSVGILTSCHLIEHLSPQWVFEFFTESFRVLQQGGKLLVETPSGISLWVTGRQFSLDPTHRNPVHPQYLEFLAQDRGFSSVEIKTYAPVHHPMRPPECEEGLWKDWIFAPMDAVCFGEKI